MINLVGEDVLDALIDKHGLDPIDMIHYLYTQHLLKDGVAGEDEYQDALGKAWAACIDVMSIRTQKRLKDFLDVMRKDCGCSM